MTKYLYPVIAAFVLVTSVFYFFPIMGHDFSLFFSWSNDYRVAWQQYGVFHVEYSPQRCLGIPVWANPLSGNFSIFHFLSLFFPNTYVAVIMLAMYMFIGFWGARKFIGLFDIDEEWKNYLSIGWVLQGCIVAHTLAGHVGYVTFALWPMYAYILLRPASEKRNKVLLIFAFAFLISHEFYLSLVYHYVMFGISFVCLLVVLSYHRASLNLKEAFIRFLFGYGLSFLIILPKVLAMLSFTRNYQRSVSFVKIDTLNAFQYSFMSKIFPLPLNYKLMTGWWYGNWESISYLYPGLVLICFLFIFIRFREYKKIAISLGVILSLGAFIASGIYGDLVSTLPIVKSFHVNPRWIPIIHLPLMYVTYLFINQSRLSRKAIVPLLALSIGLPYLVADKENMNMGYIYNSGYDPNTNRLTSCYEPVFGYQLELFPMEEALQGEWLDPRCYLRKEKCKSFKLPEKDVEALLNYRLKE